MKPFCGIVAIGSTHGDDQLGWRALDIYRQRQIPGVIAKTIASPIHLLDILPLSDNLILLDAIDGDPPGQVIRLAWPSPSLEEKDHSSSHDLGLVEILHLAEKLELLPAKVMILGITCQKIFFGKNLSHFIQSTLPELVNVLFQEIENCRPGQTGANDIC